jgi:hypothetical protein
MNKHTSAGYKFLKTFGEATPSGLNSTMGTFTLGADLLIIPIFIYKFAVDANVAIDIKGFYGGSKLVRLKLEIGCDNSEIQEQFDLFVKECIPGLKELTDMAVFYSEPSSPHQVVPEWGGKVFVLSLARKTSVPDA